MEKNSILIQPQALFEYVDANEVVWQGRGSLIEVTRDKDYHFAKDEKAEYDVVNAELLDILKRAQQCRVFDPATDDCLGFEDLVRWSISDDLLVVIDDEVLLCIAKSDKHRVINALVS